MKPKVVVPCSKTGEDCTNSECCSDSGMQCYLKGPGWSSCRFACVPGVDPADADGKPWACDELGPRKAPEPFDTPSLFCFSVMQSKGYEVELVRRQLHNYLSIFTCDEYAVISTKAIMLGKDKSGEVSTWANPTAATPMGQYGNDGATTDSFLNTQTFIFAWGTLLKSGRIFEYDFTVKADPDAVLIPNRLRKHVAAHTGESVYFTNCDKFHDDPLSPAKADRIFGALETFSKAAMQAYNTNEAKCKDMGWHSWGEDTYIQACMDMIGVGKVLDANAVGDDRCTAAACTSEWQAAFHPFKDPASYLACWDQALNR